MSLTIGVCPGGPATSLVVVQGVRDGPYEVRHLERHRGMSYPELIDRVRGIASRLRHKPDLMIDETGAGRAVVELFDSASLPCYVSSLIVTAGESSTRSGCPWRVSVRDLVSIVEVTLQTGRLRIARDLEEAPLLERELRAFRHGAGFETDGVGSVSARSDYVLAVALALFSAEVASRPSVFSLYLPWLP